MQAKNKLKDTYNKLANDWVSDHNKDVWWYEGVDKFLSLLPKGSTILDVGCGGGNKSEYMKEKGYVVTGVDFSEKMIELAKKQFPDIDFNVSDVYEIDKYPRTFDAIFAQALLLHIPKKDILKVLEKFKSRLNKGGLLFVAVKGIEEDGIEEKVHKKSNYGYDYEVFFSYYSVNELKNYLKKLGMFLISEKVTRYNKTDWIEIIAKK